MSPKKILVIRFSSIGDIVLTTPVLRCVKIQVPGVRIHYVTKEVFKPVLEHNPNIDHLWTFRNDVTELASQLAAEKFDLVIDLHKNLRSFRLKRMLGVKSVSFEKLNLQKFLAVHLKMREQLPAVHIVQRYLKTVEVLGVKDDGGGLDYFIGKDEQMNPSTLYFNGEQQSYLALVIGGSYATKQIPFAQLQNICNNSPMPVILLGGNTDKHLGEELIKSLNGKRVINTCGSLTINQSASLIQQAGWVITSDTGLMHMAAAFHKRIVSVWGNTIPEFGMGVYLPQADSRVMEVKDLSCRPCSKLGYKKCPKGHFKCMNLHDFSFVKNLK